MRLAGLSRAVIVVGTFLALLVPGLGEAKTHHARHKHHHHRHVRVVAATHATAPLRTGEGRLDLLVWRGYAEDAWVKPFEHNTGCTVVTHDALSASEMASAMRFGGDGAIDLISAPAEVTQTLIDRREVQPIDISLVPEWQNFFPQLKSPAFNTVKDVHWGLTYQWGPNTLIWNPTKVAQAPTSWNALYDPRYRDHVAIPDNVFQIADAALYLSKKQPSLKIKDPFELDSQQMAAVTALLKAQRPLVRRYWELSSQEITQFKSGRSWIGVGGPYQVAMLKAAKIPIAETIPSEGATAWADSWMLAAKAPHVTCAYLWMRWASTPQVQSAQAVFFGETPANARACKPMDALVPGSCRRYRADGEGIAKLHFQKSPQKRCGKTKKSSSCLDLADWREIWRQVRE